MKIKICIGENCHLQGAEDVVKSFQKNIAAMDTEKKISLSGSFCMNACNQKGVSVMVDNELYKVNSDDADTFFKTKVNTEKEPSK